MIHLDKIIEQDMTPVAPVRRPGLPLHGHRPGLRANDPVALHSAIVIMALRGETAHTSLEIKFPVVGQTRK